MHQITLEIVKTLNLSMARTLGRSCDTGNPLRLLFFVSMRGSISWIIRMTSRSGRFRTNRGGGCGGGCGVVVRSLGLYSGSVYDLVQKPESF